jgi:nucleotide-binding universal stress UspA family protein
MTANSLVSNQWAMSEMVRNGVREGIVMKNILIPVDGSAYSQKAVEMGKELAKAFDSTVTIVNVVTLMVSPTGRIHYDYSADIEEKVKEAEKLLEEAKSKFEGRTDKVNTVILHGDAADMIIDYANGNDFDLVIMGSHGVGAVLTRILTGSVTTKVLHHIHKPVLVIK